jgi:DNA-binding transcriptional ArsR family regulator
MPAFDVLAEPSRQRILELLRVEERAVNTLVTQLGLTQPAVSKHLRVLRDAGFVEPRIVGPRRIYRLCPGPLLELARWLEPYRALWASSLDALERHLDDTDPVEGEA